MPHLVAHVFRHIGKVFRAHDVEALTEDHFSLVVHHVIELQKLLPDIKVAALNLGLRPLKAFVHPGVHNGFALFHAERRKHLVEPFRSEDAHQIIFEAEEEGRAPWITLTARTAAQLIVDPPAFMALGGQHEEAAGVFHLLLVLGMGRLDPGAHFVGVGLRISLKRFEHLHLNIAAEFDVSAPAGHVGGDGHGTELAGYNNMHYVPTTGGNAFYEKRKPALVTQSRPVAATEGVTGR